MENSDNINNIKPIEDYKKQEEENLRKEIELEISHRKEKERAKEEKNQISKLRESDININEQLEDYKKQEEENLRKEIEYRKEKERLKEEKKRIVKAQKEIEKREHEREKIAQINENLNKKRLDNEGVYKWSESIMEHFSFATINETKEIWVYSSDLGYYVPNGEMFLLKLCADGGPRTNDPYVLRQLTMFIMGKSPKSLSEFIHPEHLINLKNGVLDMENNILLSKNPDYNFQNMLNITYNKDAKCSRWEEFIRGMFETDEDYIRTQKWFGYHLLRENKEQIMHGFVGDSGCGKGTMLHILTELLGKDNVTHFNLQEFNVRINSYALGMLYEKLANVTFDMSSAPIRDGTFEIIKNLTSGDRINARNIREAPFVFIPRAKLTFACNKLPYVIDDIINSEEFKRRMMITKVIKKQDFKKDTELYQKLLPELYNGGIFNWMLEGRKKYFKDGGFNYDHEDIPNVWNMYVDVPYKKNIPIPQKNSKKTNESIKSNEIEETNEEINVTKENGVSYVISDDDELNKVFGNRNSY